VNAAKAAREKNVEKLSSVVKGCG